MNNDLLIQRAQSRIQKPATAFPVKPDTEIAQRNFEEGLKRFQAQQGPSRLCETVRPGERAFERRLEASNEQ